MNLLLEKAKKQDFWNFNGVGYGDVFNYIYYDKEKDNLIFDFVGRELKIMKVNEANIFNLNQIINFYLKYSYPDYLEFKDGSGDTFSSVLRNHLFKFETEHGIFHTLIDYSLFSDHMIKVIFHLNSGNMRVLSLYDLDKIKGFSDQLLRDKVKEHPNGIVVTSYNQDLYQEEKRCQLYHQLSYQHLKTTKIPNRFLELMSLSKIELIYYIEFCLPEFSSWQINKLTKRNQDYLELSNNKYYSSYLYLLESLSKEQLVMLLLKQKEVDVSYFEAYKDIKQKVKMLRKMV